MNLWMRLKNSNQVFLAATLVTLLWMLMMSSLVKPLTSKQIVSFELTRTPEVASALMKEWDAQQLTSQARLSIYLDFGFLVLYSLSISLGCMVVSKFAANGFLIRIGEFLSKLILVAGLCDAVENFAMLISLADEPSVASTSIAFWFASAKFLMVVLSLVFVLACLLIGATRKFLK